MKLLEVENLSVAFEGRIGLTTVVNDLSLSIEKGKTLGIVGESGSGKSVTSLAVMGLLSANARITAGRVTFDGREILKAGTASSESVMCDLRGRRMAMIFQDPMTSLNPSFTVGYQIEETLRAHSMSGDLQARTLELLKQVGIPDPALRARSYPHQLSGGMSQRVMIAMAIACEPELLIADEPTTALDVTIQAQILSLLKKLQTERKMSLVLITHDIGVVSQMADEILVMYGGRALELGTHDQVIRDPKHPYTQALLNSLPGFSGGDSGVDFGADSAGENGGFRKRLPTIADRRQDLTPEVMQTFIRRTPLP